MPKVSQEYRDARREQILAAAKRCFLRNGFHGTSMQDLFGEAGLSSGAVYRYFPSKEDVILAIVEENLRDVIALIHTFATGPHHHGLGTALAEVLGVIRDKHADGDVGALAVLVWSESLRNPALARRLDTSLSGMRADLADIVRQAQDTGAMPEGATPDALAALLMAIVPGFILQLALFGDAAVAGIPEAARTLWP